MRDGVYIGEERWGALYIFQCKFYSDTTKVTRDGVMKTHAAMDVYDGDYAAVLTTSTVTTGAMKTAK